MVATAARQAVQVDLVAFPPNDPPIRGHLAVTLISKIKLRFLEENTKPERGLSSEREQQLVGPCPELEIQRRLRPAHL